MRQINPYHRDAVSINRLARRTRRRIAAWGAGDGAKKSMIAQACGDHAGPKFSAAPKGAG
ncbi:hypothetical protein CR492_09855 [Methylocella silvestris]|uniref:Uncharacterized protein n=1 Tax=Methylocella silvestris TaxID=199596 RepID=A0A2J7THB2_METSI|nr:hypothetical protein CR492_09855 [Methylocella silvestris]